MPTNSSSQPPWKSTLFSMFYSLNWQQQTRYPNKSNPHHHLWLLTTNQSMKLMNLSTLSLLEVLEISSLLGLVLWPYLGTRRKCSQYIHSYFQILHLILIETMTKITNLNLGNLSWIHWSSSSTEGATVMNRYILWLITLNFTKYHRTHKHPIRVM